jgi:hypothetical protein
MRLTGPISMTSQSGSEEKIEPPYHPPELPWANESGSEAAARTVQEQRESEQRQAAAKTAAEEAARQAAAQLRAHPSCVVPALKGDTLAAARHVLAAAHCRVGPVHGSVRHHDSLRVIRQGARPGKRLANDARVTLWVAARGPRSG